MVTIKELKTVTLLWGLPGSGKTTFAEEMVHKNQGYLSRAQKIKVIDADAIFRHAKSDQELNWKPDGLDEKDSQKRAVRFKRLVTEVYDALSRTDSVVIDGLFTTNKAAKEVFDALKQKTSKYKVSFEIFWWAEDKEACLWNDKKRGREFDSSRTITTMPFETPSNELLNEFEITTCVKKIVVRKSRAKFLAQQHDLGDTSTLESEAWGLGGTSGSCYDNDLQSVSASEQPTTFDKFDDLLEKLCPQVTFLQYKKLYAKTVTIKKHTSHDYYGGSIEYAKFECDLIEFFEMLEDMNLLARTT